MKGLRYRVLAGDICFWRIFVHRICSKYVLKLIKLKFPQLKLTAAEKIMFPTYVTSFIHSTTLVYYANKLRLEFNNRDWEDKELILGFNPIGRRSCELFLAYLIQDFIYLLWNHSIVKDTESLIHHFVYILIAGYNLPNHYFVYPYMWLTFGELSTPFVAIRWLLALLKLKKSKLYFLNGLALLLSFFVTRVVMYFQGLKHLYKTRRIWIKESNILCGVVAGLCSMFVLNNFWFLRILRGSLAAIQERMLLN